MAEQKRRRSCRRPCRRACRHLHRAHRTGAGAFVPSGPPSGGTFASGLGWAADVSSPVLSPILQRQGQLQRGMVPSKARRGRSARPRTVTTRNRPFPTRTSAVSAFPSWFVPPTLLDGRAAGPRRAWVYGGAGGGAPQTVEMHGGGFDGETARSRIAFQLNLVRVWVNESGRTRRPRIPNPPTRLCLGLAFDRSSFELLSARLEKVSLTRSLSSTICTCLYKMIDVLHIHVQPLPAPCIEPLLVPPPARHQHPGSRPTALHRGRPPLSPARSRHATLMATLDAHCDV